MTQLNLMEREVYNLGNAQKNNDIHDKRYQINSSAFSRYAEYHKEKICKLVTLIRKMKYDDNELQSQIKGK